ncbi:MAG: YcxB family protein [Acetobacteraceae bacterium]
MPDHPLAVTIRLRAEDHAATSTATRTVKLPTAAVGVAVLGAIIGGGVATLLNRMVEFGDGGFAWLAGALPGALILLWFGARRLENATRPPDQPEEPITVAVTPDGVAVTHADFTAQHAWRGIAAVEEQPAHILVRTRAAGVFVLPRRDFPDTAATAAFVAALRQGMAGGE